LMLFIKIQKCSKRFHWKYRLDLCEKNYYHRRTNE
jgi:hypothetical protein